MDHTGRTNTHLYYQLMPEHEDSNLGRKEQNITCTIRSTLGMSRPLAATSVQTRTPLERAENDAKAFSRWAYILEKKDR